MTDTSICITLTEDETLILYGFCEAMCFTESDYTDETPDDTPWRDKGLGIDDFTSESVLNMARVVAGFTTIVPRYVIHDYVRNGRSLREFGHDLWYTSKRHGTGFWDRGLYRAGSDILTSVAHMFEYSFSAYRGDDGELHYD